MFNGLEGHGGSSQAGGLLWCREDRHGGCLHLGAGLTGCGHLQRGWGPPCLPKNASPSCMKSLCKHSIEVPAHPMGTDGQQQGVRARSKCYLGLLQHRGGEQVHHFILSMAFPLLIPPRSAKAEAGSEGWMRPGGPCAHSMGGRGHLQAPVYSSQHPIPWQGTIPGAPAAVPPRGGVHSTHQHPPQSPQWLGAAGNGLRTRWPRPLFRTQWRGRGCRGQNSSSSHRTDGQSWTNRHDGGRGWFNPSRRCMGMPSGSQGDV